METNDKRPRRPRIGESKGINDHADNRTPENASFAADNAGDFNPENAGDARQQQQPHHYNNNYNRQGGYQQRHYQQRQGGYNNYNNGGNYQQRPFNNYRRQYNNYNAPEGEAPENLSGEGANHEESGFRQQRPYNNNYNRQGGYQQRQGGYNNRQSGYNNYNRQGGYQQRPYQQRPYNPAGADGAENPEEGGFRQQRPYQQRQGGYNNNRQGGYQQRQGGYNNNRQGGYQQRQGGFAGNRPFNKAGKPGFNKGKSFTPRPKRVEYEMPVPDPNEQIRLNKFMANAGICSRREADEFIQQGLVKVNGQVVTELGTKISHSDTVEYDEKVVTMESKCYILLNKPKDCVTTSDDPNGRLTVLDLVKGACDERIYPVGRLDRNTTGVLLLTNDGDLASKLTHPKYVKKKIYHVWVDKEISEDDMQRIADGIELDDGPIHADEIMYPAENDRKQAGIEIHSGRNRIVRRIFESLGYHVTKLDRVYFAGLTKKNLPRGRWRYLTQEEVNFLKMGTFE